MMNCGPTISTAIVETLQRELTSSRTATPIPQPSLQAAVNAFDTAFRRWKPQQFCHIQPYDKAIIDVLFSPTTCGSHRDNNYTNSILSSCQSDIRNVVANWNSRYSQWTLTKEELQQAIALLQTDTWDTYHNFPDLHPAVKLPSVADVERRIYEIDHESELIDKYQSVQIHGHKYTIQEILPKFSYKLSYNHFIKTGKEQLCDFQNVFGPKPDFIYLLTYFYLYPSVLFGECVLWFTNCNPTATGCFRFFTEKRRRITEALGSGMTYNGVVNALQLLKTETMINAELKLLSSCERLEITAVDITNFHVVKLLHDLSSPLQGFIKSCVQCKFHVVKDDVSFKTLHAEVKKFYSAPSNDRATCLAFFDLLYTLLCVPRQNDPGNNNTNPYLALLHKINVLKKVIPALLPLSYASQGHNLWKYFHEMKWVGNRTENVENEWKSCTQFCKDYDTLSTTLSSYDAFYVPSLVESLGPVVRLFSAVKQLSTCQSISLLLSTSGRSDTEQQVTIRDTKTILTDIHQLNSRIISIKDLFCNACHTPLPHPSPPQPGFVLQQSPLPTQVQSTSPEAAQLHTTGLTTNRGPVFQFSPSTQVATNSQSTPSQAGFVFQQSLLPTQVQSTSPQVAQLHTTGLASNIEPGLQVSTSPPQSVDATRSTNHPLPAQAMQSFIPPATTQPQTEQSVQVEIPQPPQWQTTQSLAPQTTSQSTIQRNIPGSGVISNTVVGNLFRSPQQQPATTGPPLSQTFPATPPQSTSLPTSGNITISVGSGASSTNLPSVQDVSSATSQATNQPSSPPAMHFLTTKTPLQQQVTIQTESSGTMNFTIGSGLILNSLSVFQFGPSISQEKARPAHDEPPDIPLSTPPISTTQQQTNPPSSAQFQIGPIYERKKIRGKRPGNLPDRWRYQLAQK